MWGAGEKRTRVDPTRRLSASQQTGGARGVTMTGGGKAGLQHAEGAKAIKWQVGCRPRKREASLASPGAPGRTLEPGSLRAETARSWRKVPRLGVQVKAWNQEPQTATQRAGSETSKGRKRREGGRGGGSEPRAREQGSFLGEPVCYLLINDLLITVHSRPDWR